MVKRLIALAALLPAAVSAQVYDYGYGNYGSSTTMQSRYIDVTPGDGIMDVGSPSNPYIFKDHRGNVVGEIRSKHIDVTPGDGIMEPGTFGNPYVIKRR